MSMTGTTTIPINEGIVDRGVRAMLGLVLFQIAFFWLPTGWSMVGYAVGTVMLLTAAVGFCPLYRLLVLSTLRTAAKPPAKVWVVVFVLLFAVVLFAGSYGSHFFSKKIFLEDFNTMNAFYKQTLYQTGQNNREQAVANYDRLVTEYTAFQAKYSAYQPYALKSDGQFQTDLARVSTMIAQVETEVQTSDLYQAHLALEEIRPVFQNIFKRNDFSMLAVALVDFHDVMELVLDQANAQNPEGVIETYQEADVKLKVVEAEANDAEIQAIRQNLDDLQHLAERDAVTELPAKAGQLKSSFVKVYLTRG